MNTEELPLNLYSAVEPQRTQRAQSEKPTRGKFTFGVNFVRLITSHQAWDFALSVFFAVRWIAEFRLNRVPEPRP
jgi:hypothetical protein